MMDRNLFSRALHWLLQRALPETRCPNGGKKHNISACFSQDRPCHGASTQLELWEGLELHFQGSLGSVECSTPSPAPLTHWELLPVENIILWLTVWSLERIGPERKGFSQCFVALGLCLAPPSPPFEICPACCPLHFLDTPGLVSYFVFTSISFSLLIYTFTDLSHLFSGGIIFFISEKGPKLFSKVYSSL